LREELQSEGRFEGMFTSRTYEEKKRRREEKHMWVVVDD
jgi:hypothetical protein